MIPGQVSVRPIVDQMVVRRSTSTRRISAESVARRSYAVDDLKVYWASIREFRLEPLLATDKRISHP